MGMALPTAQTYVVWSINGREVHREPLTTFDLGPLRNKLAVMMGANDLIDVKYVTVEPPDGRSRAERRGKKPQTRGPNKHWWNK